MTPIFDIVTQEKARKEASRLLIGVQIGVWGFIIRLGIYI